jgi:hypothetical protein
MSDTLALTDVTQACSRLGPAARLAFLATDREELDSSGQRLERALSTLATESWPWIHVTVTVDGVARDFLACRRQSRDWTLVGYLPTVTVAVAARGMRLVDLRLESTPQTDLAKLQVQ